MIQVGDAYKELVKSNIRPKCEPIIKVSGVDNTGKEIELIWNAKNIKDLKYKRAIDPVGRELPYMELTWTEIYTGKLNAENYPEKYNNIIKYMKVELVFVQDLDFRNCWKTVFNGGIKWKELFLKTWKQVKKETSQELIKMPILFLNAKPTIKGKTITWVAKDLIAFMNEKQIGEFDGDGVSDIILKNIVSFFVLNARSGFLKSIDLFKAYTESVTKLLARQDVNESMDKRIICDGNTNNIVLNLLSIYNYYLDFEYDVFVIKRFEPLSTSAVFRENVLYQYPTIEKSTNISAYSFKHRLAERDAKKAYYKEPYNHEEYGGVNILQYALNGYGEAYLSEGESQDIGNRINIGEPNVAYRVGNTANDTKIYVVPINYNAYKNIININNVGEVFDEDNPINPYDSVSNVAVARKNFLNSYFSSDCSGLCFESLPNVALETNDVIEVDTNLYDQNGNKIVKKALIVSIELNYNGSLKQKIKAHEVIL